jgi:hypothetical protein
MSKVLPTLRCPECRDSFTPIPRRDGSLPSACKGCIRVFNWKQHRELFRAALKKGSAEKKRRARARVEAQLHAMFGAISERDAALYAYGLSLGYARGYDAAYYFYLRRVKEQRRA